MSTRLYVCYWSTAPDVIERQPIEFFNADNGYHADDVAEIDDLLLGESIDLSDGMTQNHFIMRVQ
jgi:hypothetical protein